VLLLLILLAVCDRFSKACDIILCMTEQMTLKKQTNEHPAVCTWFLPNAHLLAILSFPTIAVIWT